jgi:L-seryl-tRNA(Ser) seleniumtransferase
MRAVRADKLTYAALEATLALWAQAPARSRIPAYRMLSLTLDEIDRRARAVLARLTGVSGLTCAVIDGVSTIGGGAAPGSAWPTRLIALALAGVSPDELDRRLRAHSPAVVARIHDQQVVIDLRTVLENEDEVLADAVRASAQWISATDWDANFSRPPGKTPR